MRHSKMRGRQMTRAEAAAYRLLYDRFVSAGYTPAEISRLSGYRNRDSARQAAENGGGYVSALRHLRRQAARLLPGAAADAAPSHRAAGLRLHLARVAAPAQARRP